MSITQPQEPWQIVPKRRYGKRYFIGKRPKGANGKVERFLHKDGRRIFYWRTEESALAALGEQT